MGTPPCFDRDEWFFVFHRQRLRRAERRVSLDAMGIGEEGDFQMEIHADHLKSSIQGHKNEKCVEEKKQQASREGESPRHRF